MPLTNLYAAVPQPTSGERFEQLLRCANVRIERIVSSARTASELYSQNQDEWVALLQGEARLEMAGEERLLKGGDCLFIPAGTPHRVLTTSSDPLCIWLAIHIFPVDDVDDPPGDRYTGGG